MRGAVRGAIPSRILHAALHCCLSMLILQMMMPHRCYYVLMACIDVTMHLMACSTASTTPHCLACCMCMHRLPMCISGRERWGWALELRSEVRLKFCTYESCLISKYIVVWGSTPVSFFCGPARTSPLACTQFPARVHQTCTPTPPQHSHAHTHSARRPPHPWLHIGL